MYISLISSPSRPALAQRASGLDGRHEWQQDMGIRRRTSGVGKLEDLTNVH